MIVDPAQLEGITDEDAAAVGKVCKQNIKALRDYAGREPRPGHRRMVFRFLTSPIEIKGDGKVERDRARPQRTGHRRQRMGVGQGHRRARGTCRFSWSCGRSATAACPLPGCRSTRRARPSPTRDGRVEGSRNEYVVGWIKRGPTGVIGTNKKDSQDTVDTLLADWPL